MSSIAKLVTRSIRSQRGTRLLVTLCCLAASIFVLHQLLQAASTSGPLTATDLDDIANNEDRSSTDIGIQSSAAYHNVVTAAGDADRTTDSQRLANLSRQLNVIQRDLQQLVCLKNRHQSTSVSDTGGWCNPPTAVEHRTDAGLAAVLARLFIGRRVASFGEGLGRYRRLLLDTGLVDGFDAFDGSPFVEELTDGLVRFLDLAVPQFWLPVYDWTMSLEVLEHVPERFEEAAVDNVVRPARRGVVLSWARPGQGGFGHVNPRPAAYVDELMRHHGFDLDVDWSNRLRDASTFNWFKFTLNVYRRTNESLKLFDWRTEFNSKS